MSTHPRSKRQFESASLRGRLRIVKWVVAVALILFVFEPSLFATNSFAEQGKHEVKLDVFVDSRICEEEWNSEVKEWIHFAADRLEEASNVRTTPGRMEWLELTAEEADAYNYAKLRKMNARIKASRHRSDTICLALLAGSDNAVHAFLQDANILLFYGKRHTERAKWVLLHELAHLFGAVHLKKTGAVMNPHEASRGKGPLRFDERNLAIMDLARKDVLARGAATFDLRRATLTYGEQIVSHYVEAMQKQSIPDRLSNKYWIADYYVQSKQHERGLTEWIDVYDLLWKEGGGEQQGGDLDVIHDKTGLTIAAAACRVGNCLVQLGRHSEVLDFYTTACEREPKNFRYVYMLGGCYARMSEIESALEAFEQCAEIGSDNGEYWYNYGLTLLRGTPADVWSGERIELAKECIEEAVEYKHEEANAHLALAVILYHQGLGDESETHLMKALELGASPYRPIRKKDGRFWLGFSVFARRFIHGTRSKMSGISLNNIQFMYLLWSTL